MTEFMGKDFLLNTETAKTLYHAFAENAPILDYHCHINPRDVFEDVRYENISQLWLGVGGTNFGDHYKWRLMRSFGVEEKYISGTGPDRDRFRHWAACISRAIGNPLYHWSMLELKRYFGIDQPLNESNADRIYDICNERLRDADMSVRGIIEQSNVRLICTTDDPADSLEWHIKLKNDDSFKVQVIPAMRPDKAKNISDADFPAYLQKLGKAAGISIASFEDLKRAVSLRMDLFETLGACVSDHAFEYVPYEPATDAEIEAIFSMRLAGEQLSATDCEKYQTAFMRFAAEEYSRRNWVMQLHYGALRNNNTKAFERMGADTGFDCINNFAPNTKLVRLLDSFEMANSLPKTIIYSLNPSDNQIIGAMLGCFQSDCAAAKIQQGSAWWFNDHLQGMTEQLVSLANLGNLSGFVGMLTDSRSFLSYTRHEYFRRILCRLFGEWVEEGLYPADWDTLGAIMKDICYNNAVRYFGFDLRPY